jgi:c-di-GMP phosphodiesterase Gmr
MVLVERTDSRGASLDVITAVPPKLIGLRWTIGAFLRRVIDGRVSVTFSNRELEEWRDIPRDLLSPGQPALYLPIHVRHRRGILILLRNEGSLGFDRSHVSLARKFAVLASHALAARHATQSEAESRRLRQLTEQLRRSEQNAQRNSELLQEIVSLLPVSLTVQDEDGRFTLVNDAAATCIGRPGADLVGVTSFDLYAEPEAARRREVEVGLMRSGNAVAREETIATAVGERTLLTTLKPVRIFDEKLLLSTSLDITERKLAETELARRAYFDDLTGLPNRARMQDEIEGLLHAGGPISRFALAFIDLDDFKHINDY